MVRALMARTFLSLAVSAALVFPRPAGAAPQEGAPAGSAEPLSAEEAALAERDRKAEAQVHFEKGVALTKQRAWEAALAESLLSRELFPTKSATYNIAFCLKNLQRFDEALEMFEALLREHPNLPPDEKADTQREIDELRAVVGTVEITGAKPGASIVIDGRPRGDYPPVNPIRVSAGAHTVRVFKAGYRAFEKRVDVVGGRTVTVPASLLVLTDAGRLKVTEKTGKEIDVLVDSVLVGKTPWEGTLAVGDHVVVLRGEGSVGTPPAAASVKARQLSTLSLSAEELEATLRVDPTPAEASVIIDTVSVGRGTWQGALRSGAHRVEVRQEGYLPVKRQVTLARGQQDRLTLALARDPESELWRKPPKITFDTGLGLAVVPSLGGEVASGCVDPCSQSIGLGGLGLFHAGYEYGSGFSIGGTAGYLLAMQGIEGHTSRIQPVSLESPMRPPPKMLPPNPGKVNDQLRLSALVLGATVGYRRGESFPVLARLGAGVVLGSVRDQRDGSFEPTPDINKPFTTYPVASSAFAAYAYVDPELQIGVHLSERFDLGVGVQALLLFALAQPRFSNTLELAAGPSIGTYPNETLTGRIVFLLVPGISARYAF